MQSRFGVDLLRVAVIPGTALLMRRLSHQALADASSLIDGYLAGRYPPPLAHVPTVLVPICCDIARHRLYGEQARATGSIGRHRVLEVCCRGELALLAADGEQLESQNLAELQSDVGCLVAKVRVYLIC